MKLSHWRRGYIHLNEETISINGSLQVPIKLKNLLTLNFVFKVNGDRRLIIDSKTYAVEIKFQREEEFNEFRQQLLTSIECYEDQIEVVFTS